MTTIEFDKANEANATFKTEAGIVTIAPGPTGEIMAPTPSSPRVSEEDQDWMLDRAATECMKVSIAKGEPILKCVILTAAAVDLKKYIAEHDLGFDRRDHLWFRDALGRRVGFHESEAVWTLYWDAVRDKNVGRF